MLRILLVAVVAIPVSAAMAASNAKPHTDVSQDILHGPLRQSGSDDAKDAITHAAKACTKQGAFGRAFAGKANGHVDTTAEAEWAPFEKLTIAGNQITAVASFHEARDTREDDIALAKKFLKAFEQAVEHKFPHRENHSDGVSFRSGKEPGTGLVFDIRQDEDRVIADCTDAGE